MDMIFILPVFAITICFLALILNAIEGSWGWVITMVICIIANILSLLTLMQ